MASYYRVMPVDVPNTPSTPNGFFLPVEVCRLAAADVWIFDLDNTLYSASSNLFPAIERRMAGFIAGRLGVTLEEARRRQKRFFHEHGTTLRGLMLEHDVDPLAFLEYVHAIDLSVITPDPALDRALGRLPGRKLVFTNASRRHAEGVMARLGIARHFEAIHDIVAAGFLPKPDPRPYAGLVSRYDVNPARACMVEDMAGNLAPAAALGMTTVWLRTDSAWGQPAAGDTAHIHHIIDDLPAWLGALAWSGS